MAMNTKPNNPAPARAHLAWVGPVFGRSPSGSAGLCRVLHTGLFALLALVATAGLLAAPAALADSHKDQDRARQALMQGKVLSLRQVLDAIEPDYPGEPVEIEFEDDEHEDRFIYEIKLLQSGGTIVKLKVDAQTGKVIHARSRSREQKDD